MVQKTCANACRYDAMDSDGEEDDDSQATDQGPVLAPKKETAEQRRLREIREAFLAKRKADLAELCELPSVVRAFEAWLEDEDRGELSQPSQPTLSRQSRLANCGETMYQKVQV